MMKTFPHANRLIASAILLSVSLTCLRSLDAAKPAEIRTHAKRIVAPPLADAGEWLNTSRALNLKRLRGKFVVLDFWTYCCINCMHVLPELEKLERQYANEVVVIGVHVAKFSTERVSQNVQEAIQRYEIEHPVINDAEGIISRRYGVSAWPTFQIIDPEGYVIATHIGEAKFAQFERFFRRAIPVYARKKTLNNAPLRLGVENAKASAGALLFPGKVLADEKSGRLFVSDSGHHRIVVTNLDGKLLQVIGTGARGRKDGKYNEATFNHPQGLALEGHNLYVADTKNHLLRAVNLNTQRVATIAGTGEQAADPIHRATAPQRALSSPWDLVVHDESLFIAMAGCHQIWKMSLASQRIGPFAGNGTEDIVDGRLLPRKPYQTGFASFAQPSGLSTDGRRLFVADSEGSSLRAVMANAAGAVETLVGTAEYPDNRLFIYGDRDGQADRALLQHPLGVAYHDNRLFVADTYNNKVKEFRLDQGTIKTIAGDRQAGHADQPARFNEPCGISYAAGKIYVADTNNHAIRVIEATGEYAVTTLAMQGLAAPATIDSPATQPSTGRAD